MEAPSERYASVPVDGPQAGKAIMPHWEALRSNYYKNMGWDSETGSRCLKLSKSWDWDTSFLILQRSEAGGKCQEKRRDYRPC